MGTARQRVIWCLLTLGAVAGLTFHAAAGSTGPVSAKDYQYGFEVDIKPVQGDADQYYCVANFMDLYSNRRITSPKLLIPAGERGEIKIGDNGTELISLSVKVEADRKSAEVEATIQKHSFTVWHTRVKFNL